MLGASVRARPSDGFHGSKRFAAKLDLCLYIVTAKPWYHRGGAFWNAFVLGSHFYPYL
jgi:hypothetical protein